MYSLIGAHEKKCRKRREIFPGKHALSKSMENKQIQAVQFAHDQCLLGEQA
jgi:hypothetical protein